MVDRLERAGRAAAPRMRRCSSTSSKSIPTSSTSNICWPGSTAMAIFIVAMIGGGITFIDDKSRGLHEGYLLTPIHKTELVLGLIGAGAIKGLHGRHGAHALSAACSRAFPGCGIRCGCFYLMLGGSGRVAGHDQLHVSGDGARGRSAGAARDFRRAEYAAVFSVRRDFSDRRLSAVAARGFR